MKSYIQLNLQLALLVTVATFSNITKAGDDYDDAKNTLTAAEYETGSDWSFEFMPYLWAAGVEGSSSIGNLTSSYDYDFDEIIGDLDMAAAFVGGFKYKRLGFLADFQYMKLSPGRPTRGPVFGDVNLSLKQTSLALLGTYDLIANDRFTFTLVGGTRYLNVDTTLTVTPGVVPRGFSRRSVQTSWDVVGGFRAKYFLNDQLFVSAYADFGGGDSDQTWQAYGGLGYLLSDHWHTSVGYRVLSYETSNGRASSNQETGGIFLGLGYRY